MKKLINYLNKGEEILASSLLILTSLLVFVQVVLRYQFNYSISWSEELSRIMIAWFIFLGSSMAVKDNAHVNMDALFILTSGKFKQILSILIDFINIIFCILIVIAGVEMIQSAIDIGSKATSINIPLYVPYASVPVGVFLMMIRYIFSIKNKILDLINGNI
ncbi:TRAP transporter small permease [Maledivibacter halophilus]|uniref:C4-dicarboxylate transporter, DctQ subunit n=1 Tax=Maledivibacter halophilus TaxID=36842 RepID=A0A1T5MMA9_9FIRM|nr:TRAP transporter small permease [Maledivibacter halophilus]SKC89355.1 C4-dicarboxylate transporter, DctQ subunit [Maledivibacter halophilus]